MSHEYVLGKDMPIDALPFSEKKQDAIIGWLLRKDHFFLQSKGRLSHGYFIQPLAQKLVSAMFGFDDRYQRRPSFEELYDSPSLTPEDPGTKQRLRDHLARCLEASTLFGLDVLEAELTDWLQFRAFQGLVEQSVRLYNQQKGREAVDLVATRSAEIRDIRFVQDNTVDPGNFKYLFDDRTEELQDAITFGSTTVDRLLNPAARSGALLRKDMTLLLGMTNSGKTRTMTTILRHNAMRGKHCLFMIHEGNDVDVGNLIYSALISRPAAGGWVTPQVVREQLYHTAEGRRIIEQARDVWNERICFMPMIKSGTTVEEVMTTVRRKQDEWAAKHQGHGFDLFVDDYPAVLTTTQNARGNMQERNLRHHIYLQFNLISGECGFHTIVAYQSNREGAKATKGRSERSRRRLLVREDMEEAWGPAETAPNIVTITRDDDMMHNGHVIFLVDKSRTGPTGFAAVCRSRYDACITHDDALGVTYYAGTESYTPHLEVMLQQYPDQQVPTAFLLSTHAPR